MSVARSKLSCVISRGASPQIAPLASFIKWHCTYRDTFAIWLDTFAIWLDTFAMWLDTFAIWLDTFAMCPAKVGPRRSNISRNSEA